MGNKNSISVMGPADLRVKCLCGCKQSETFSGVTVTVEAVMDEEEYAFLYFKVRFSCDLHTHAVETYARVQVRGETNESVFAFPCLEYRPGGLWLSVCDSRGDHFAIKAKGSKVVGSWQ